MQQEYEPIVREAVAVYRDLYGSSLVSVFVTGSVAWDEAVPGYSDLDMGAFVDTPLPPDAREVHRAAVYTRLAAWPHARVGVGRPRPLSDAFAAGEHGVPWRRLVQGCLNYVQQRDRGAPSGGPDEAAARFVGFAFTLRYDAIGVFGTPLAALLNGRPRPEPDALFARIHLHTPLETVRLAAQGQQHPEFPLPETPKTRLRKLGRLAVLLGAGLPMARGQFQSLRGVAVLPAVEAVAPGWAPFLRDTARVYRVVQPDAPDQATYLSALVAFADWVEQEVANATRAENSDA